MRNRCTLDGTLLGILIGYCLIGLVIGGVYVFTFVVLLVWYIIAFLIPGIFVVPVKLFCLYPKKVEIKNYN